MAFLKINMVFFLLIVILMNITSAQEWQIEGIHPSSKIITIFINESQKFSIKENYDSIKWYVDGILTIENINYFEFEDYGSGIYSVRVDVLYNKFGETKTWDVVVKKDREFFVEKKNIDYKEILFFVSIIIILIFIMLFVILLIARNKKNANE